MPDINWGILQPLNQMAPIQSSAPSAGGAPGIPSGGGVLGGAQEDPYAAQKMEMEQARLGLSQNADRRAEEQQVGLLKQQELAQQEISLKLQDAAAKKEAEMMNAKQREERTRLYNEVSEKSGSKAGLDAVQEALFKQGHVELGLSMAKTMEDLEHKKATNDIAGMQVVSSALYGTMQAAKPPVIDPKTGQEVEPGVTPLDNYRKIYPLLSKEWPRAPKPDTFKTSGDYEDALVHPVLDQAKDPLKAEKAKQDELNKNKLYQGQQLVQQRTNELQAAIRQHGADSKEARDAAKALQQNMTDSERQARGGDAGTFGSFMNTIKGAGIPSEGKLIAENAAELPGAPVPPATSVPTGRITVKSPDGSVGTIPAEQLEEALKSGYAQVK